MSRSHIIATSGRITFIIPFAEVLYFRSENKWIVVRHQHGEVVINATLIALEQEYKTELVRVHRNCLVPPHLIREYGRCPWPSTKYYVKIDGVDEPLDMSRRNVKFVKELLRREHDGLPQAYSQLPT